VVAAVITIKDISLTKARRRVKETESKYRQLIGFKVEDKTSRRLSYKYG
jgi:hypothetical protein